MTWYERYFNSSASLRRSSRSLPVRHIIDYAPPRLETLREAVEQGGSDELVELFVDYLNFFEFIASLWKLGQLRINEVAMLFQYYLENLTDKPFIVRFIREQGFENLEKLLAALDKQRKTRLP
ncbi:MAG TPA: hypothetical protein VGQ76_07130 [Thermoanaerobaculia bacterium]|nr:hypothetical protein [Thermoanaerobaculia bacterium]